MATNNKQTQHESTEEVNFEMRRSFSWDGAFLASDGFLAGEELSSMIEGGELQKIEELETMEAKLFQEIKASTQKSTTTSQAKKVIGSGGSNKDAPIKKPPTMASKTIKDNAEPLLKTLPAIRTKKKVGTVNTRVSRTTPASPVSPRSPGSSSSTFGVSQRSKRSGSAPRISSVNNEKPSATNTRRKDDQKASKPTVSLLPKLQSSITLKSKSSPSSSTTTQRSPKSLSCTFDQRSKLRGIISPTAHHISKPALKNQTSDLNRKQPAKTANTGLKPNSPKTTPPKKQSSPKAKASPQNIFVISPELLDLKEKINALKMGIDLHKKDRCSKMARAERVEVT